ncbi:MAG: glycosyltransferase [Lachnospiraceae bacterium]|nr:glycosyltransferase [Lachnospiraceae bacterium]
MSDRRKLLLIVPTLHQGGQERVVVRTAGLLADDFDITIAIFDDSDIGYDVSAFNVVNLNVPARSGLILKLINTVRRFVKLRRLKSRIRPYISYSFGRAANIANSLTRMQSSLTWVGLRTYPDVTEISNMRLFISHSDRIVCCSEDIEKAVIERFAAAIAASGTQVSLLRNPFDIDGIRKDAYGDDSGRAEFPTTTEEGRPISYIMTMGREADLKMYWRMLKIFKLIQMTMPDTRLIIMGAGEYEPYKRMAEWLGITDFIRFMGACDNPYKYVRYADVYWTTSRTEGFPNAVVEALAVGLPIVSTNCWVGPAEILAASGVQDCEAEFEARFTISERGDDSGWLQAIEGYPVDWRVARNVADHPGLAALGFDVAPEPAADVKPEQVSIVPDIPESRRDSGRPMAIYAQYGVITPALTMEKDMDFAHITPADFENAHVMIDMLRDKALCDHYRSVAEGRAREYSYERYREEFLKMATASNES